MSQESEGKHSEPEASLWARIRAALIFVAIALSLLEGLPVPHMRRHHLEREVGRRELHRWAEFLRRFDPALTDESLKEQALVYGGELEGLHYRLVEPFRPLFSALQVRQQWSLFPVADPNPWWMHIDLREGNTWRTVYRPNDPEADWDYVTLQYRRIRGVWNPGTSGPRYDYPRFVDMAAERAFAAFPNVEEVRVRFQQYRVPVPVEGEREAPAPTWHFEERRSR